MNQALTKPERIEALTLALRAFTHKNVHLHDYELTLGADKALCLKLGYVVVTSKDPFEELNLIGKCLLQIYQSSSEQRMRSFRSVGATELVPLLVQVLMNVFWSTENVLSPDQEEVVGTVVQVLRNYTKLESAKSLLIRLNQGAWLGRILNYCVGSIGAIGATMPIDVSSLCTEILGLVKDLTFRSSQTDKEIIMSVHDGIFGGLLATICNARTNLDTQIVEWFTAVIWNLVLDKAICDQFMENEKIHDFPVLKYLLRVLRVDDNSEGRDRSRQSKIRRNATSSIGNILAHAENQRVLFGALNREKLDILPTLMRLVEADGDSIVRRRAMRTIRCIVSSQTSEICQTIKNEDLATLLVDTISRNISLDDENDRDMQIQACQAISFVVDQLSGGDWPRIETALLQRVETSNDEKLINAACACLTDCVKNSPWRRGPSCFSEMFWTRLEATASSSVESHLQIASLLLELAWLEKEVVTETSREDPSTLTNTTVVNTLTSLVSQAGKDQGKSRRLALETIVLLVEKEANRRPLAENESLLSGLVNLCLLQPDEDSKAIAKQTIICLVPEL